MELTEGRSHASRIWKGSPLELGGGHAECATPTMPREVVTCAGSPEPLRRDRHAVRRGRRARHVDENSGVPPPSGACLIALSPKEAQ